MGDCDKLESIGRIAWAALITFVLMLLGVVATLIVELAK